ncbi:MAG TPA: enolase C-terminal domain-like protein [Acidimicrobiales bacterium]|nr:enolase C-terminal domain-like protein [Acidimicrobiales bacterium]
MRYDGLELWWVDLALRQPVGTSAGTHRARPVVFVRVLAGGGDGWGECGALPDGTAVDPALDAVWGLLAEVVPARLGRAAAARGGEVPPASVVAHLFDTTPANRMAAAVVEMAVLDLELQAAGRSLADHLGVPDQVRAGGPGGGVPAGAVVGIPDDGRLRTLVAAVGRQVDRGYGRVRVKIRPGWDVAPLAALRDAFPDLVLQADANAAYRVDDAGRLAELDDLGIGCLEQPLAAADLAGHADLAGRLATPIGLDESLTTVRAVADAIRYGACRVACLKPARLGGLLAARRAQDRCRQAGVSAFVGGLFETGLGRTANAVLSGLPGLDLPGDLSDPSDYLVDNPAPYPRPVGGRVPLPAVPGVGSRPDRHALSQLGALVERFDRAG